MAGSTTHIPDRQRDLEIAGLTADSRAVKPGYLFAALPGTKADGRSFLAAAAKAGAVAALAPEGTQLPREAGTLALLEDPRPRRLFARMAAAFYGRQPQTIAAVTGTSGKTSTVQFARQLWGRLGAAAGSMGTLGTISGPVNRYAGLTTSDPVQLHAHLAELAEAGVTHLALEASSHGLDQYRLDGLKLAAAAFTNLSQDHLDYHDSLDAYFVAKARLFGELLPPGAVAVLNADAAEFGRLEALCRNRGHRILSYGRAGRDLRLLEALPDRAGQALRIEVLGRTYETHLRMAAAFQASNALCALALVIGTGHEPEAAVTAIDALEEVRGRMELAARHPRGAPIYVDYAHKPGALQTVLEALRAQTAGRLVLVFGCGGDRDRGKRPIMGEIAGRLADRVIVTDDNPRSEDPAAIRREILAGCPGATDIGDRAEAIRAAVRDLGPEDVLVIAGKGHEQGQVVGATVRPFDDAAEARVAVQELAR
jgi:UDP-N-acetylmuramoyl-L-alanyl-D-glutamate--2,6-diaminopimelate ligase